MGEAGASPPTATSAQPIVTQLSKRQTSSKKKRGFFRFFLLGRPRTAPRSAPRGDRVRGVGSLCSFVLIAQ